MLTNEREKHRMRPIHRPYSLFMLAADAGATRQQQHHLYIIYIGMYSSSASSQSIFSNNLHIYRHFGIFCVADDFLANERFFVSVSNRQTEDMVIDLMNCG